MGKFSGCLLASDIDGTLMESNVVNPENLKQIDYFLSEGGMFSVATGRACGALKPVLKWLNKVSPSVVSNGCMIYDFEKGETLRQYIISNSDKLTLKEITENFPMVGIEIFCGNEVYTINKTVESAAHCTYEEFEAPFISIEKAIQLDWNKVIFFIDDDPKNADIIKERLKGIVKNSNLVNTNTTINGKRRNYLEQVPQGISKAVALKELCQMFSIKKLFAIGDYYNDIEMIKMADIGALTLNAPQELKPMADYITCSCAEGAVADFIKYLDSRH